LHQNTSWRHIDIKAVKLVHDEPDHPPEESIHSDGRRGLLCNTNSKTSYCPKKLPKSPGEGKNEMASLVFIVQLKGSWYNRRPCSMHALSIEKMPRIQSTLCLVQKFACQPIREEASASRKMTESIIQDVFQGQEDMSDLDNVAGLHAEKFWDNFGKKLLFLNLTVCQFVWKWFQLHSWIFSCSRYTYIRLEVVVVVVLWYKKETGILSEIESCGFLHSSGI
jgi:hypothetical protein